MNVPPDFHPKWRDIVSGKVKFEFEFLAAKILLGTMTRTLAKDPTPTRLEKCTGEFRELFAKNTEIPSVRRDLERIFGEELP